MCEVEKGQNVAHLSYEWSFKQIFFSLFSHAASKPFHIVSKKRLSILTILPIVRPRRSHGSSKGGGHLVAHSFIKLHLVPSDNQY